MPDPLVATDAMRQYSMYGLIAYFSGKLWSVAILFVFLHTGLAARLRDEVLRKHDKLIVQVAALYTCIALSVLALYLPVHFAGDFLLERAFGFQQESLFTWLSGYVINGVLDVIPAILLLTIAFAAVRRWPQNWGLVLFGMGAPLILVASAFSGYFFDLIPFEYKPLDAGPLRTRLERLAEKAGLKDVPILVEEASQETKKVNASTIGVGSSVRIIIFDNAIANMKEDEIEMMVAHEIGHHQMGDFWTRNCLSIAELLVLLLGAQFLAPYAVRRFPLQWGIKKVDDIAIIPAGLLAASIISFLLLPVNGAINKYFESRADDYALNLTGDGAAMARMLSTYARLNLEEPDPPALVQLWFSRHPSVRARVERALYWQKSHSP
ncbi:MAG TPA: M48 family metalloprotease [Candidatus Obscuribacterales bacterium]